LKDIIIPVYLNGAMDHDGNYYKVVTIGTQTWMAENLNVGSQLQDLNLPKDNGIIEKLCNANTLCDIYGGLYDWNEAMQYKNPDNGIVGTIQGICPDGWHIPTLTEWRTLSDYIGGDAIAGEKLREKGFAHWVPPNLDATDDFGFSALPGGWYDVNTAASTALGNSATWWTSSSDPRFQSQRFLMWLKTDLPGLYKNPSDFTWYCSVRCVKNQGKK
jgi:uncharacterized protein (TIGR02145 family)